MCIQVPNGCEIETTLAQLDELDSMIDMLHIGMKLAESAHHSAKVAEARALLDDVEPKAAALRALVAAAMPVSHV